MAILRFILPVARPSPALLHLPSSAVSGATKYPAVTAAPISHRPSPLFDSVPTVTLYNHNDAVVARRPKRLTTSFRCLSALNPELKTTLDKVVTSQKVVLFMKGTKEFPQCGFSNTVVQILKSLNVPFETINILENEVLRQALKEYSSWPTFPQLYIDGEFFGGCDITVDAYQRGELQELLEKAINS
ncbi:Monothiol glutaredoxin-S14, chloroplastic [Dionaea muscipula]